jgi:hypothetical protein
MAEAGYCDIFCTVICGQDFVLNGLCHRYCAVLVVFVGNVGTS